MITILFFSTVQLLVSGFAWWRGGKPERWVAVLLLLAAVASVLVSRVPHVTPAGVNWPILQIDLLLLLALAAVAMFADRFWPMWVSALQVVSVASHGLRAYDTSIVPYAYWWLATKFAYPMLVILLLGTLRHAARQRHGIRDWDWSVQRWRHERRADIGDRAQ